MRQLSSGLCAASLLLLLAAGADVSPAQALKRGEVAVQPTKSRSDLVLHASSGAARVESRGRSTSIALEPEEELTAIVETASGWVAAGVRRELESDALFLVAQGTSGVERMSAPRRRQPLQLRPVLLVRGGELVGAAWLEGPDHRSLAVRFAEWTGLDWGATETVARPGPGSQTGLTGVALASGEILLAWSRFDGRDDEIFWSRRENRGWSRAARLGSNNATPDVTPALAASGRGAILVWSRLEDSEYRLLTSRFLSGDWTPERPIGGPGSLFPSWIEREGRLYALYRSARPRGWSVTEFDEKAPAARQAFIEAPSAARPILTPTEQGARFEWTSGERGATSRWERLARP